MEEKIEENEEKMTFFNKISKFNKKLKIKHNGKKEDLIRKYHSIIKSEDFKNIKKSLFQILLYGLSINLFLHLFGVHISILNILCIGSGVWIFEIKLLDMLLSILSSFKLIQVNK